MRKNLPFLLTFSVVDDKIFMLPNTLDIFLGYMPILNKNGIRIKN